ncbi:MAPKAP1 [Cordylochernes scorpioides]|uniref:Target of rapamycin complex 2 subunit MAPKAP1 n=1 Tax=Cordylochernes scorpioides TaxID=51811 RepID=A0ABY6K1S6_9ARAC|nr:MAPKAP1 [Cordylochernes scorpioides]
MDVNHSSTSSKYGVRLRPNCDRYKPEFPNPVWLCAHTCGVGLEQESEAIGAIVVASTPDGEISFLEKQLCTYSHTYGPHMFSVDLAHYASCKLFISAHKGHRKSVLKERQTINTSPDFLLSSIRHSFITCDDTGMCEMVMVNEPVTLPSANNQPPSPDDYYGCSDFLENSGCSYDILSDMAMIGAHRRRSNTAQRLDKLKKEKKDQANIKTVCWKEPSSSLSAEELEHLFPKKSSTKVVAARKSILTEQLAQCPTLPTNPFNEYARFNGKVNDGQMGVKKLQIFLPHLSEEHSKFPMDVEVLGSARVLDLIGLICWQYTANGLQPPLNPTVNRYCLRIVEETGEVDLDFPSLDPHEPIAKFDFPIMALVEREDVPDSSPGSASGDTIVTLTISRRLVANGLHSCRPLRRLPLTPPNRSQRLEWCRARSTWMTEWHRVVFSDESRFCLSSDSRRVRVWRRRGERSNPAAIVERPTVRQRGIMVWGAIAYDSRSPLLRIQGTMTAQQYVDDVLRPVTLPYLQGVPNALYQQDNARPHTARISQQALQDVQMLPWPPYSPDLSPIEHVWDIIGRRLHALPQLRSEDELYSEEGFSKIQLPSLDVTLAMVLEQTLKHRKEDIPESQFRLEKRTHPGVALDLSTSVADAGCLEFRLVCLNNGVMQSEGSSDHMLVEVWGLQSVLEAPLYQAYSVVLVHQLGRSTEVQLGISSEKVEVTPLSQHHKSPAVKLWTRQFKPLTYNLDSIAACEMVNKKCRSGRAMFKLVYTGSKGPEFKHHLFESESFKAQEIVKKVQYILQTHSSQAHKAYLASAHS